MTKTTKRSNVTYPGLHNRPFKECEVHVTVQKKKNDAAIAVKPIQHPNTAHREDSCSYPRWIRIVRVESFYRSILGASMILRASPFKQNTQGAYHQRNHSKIDAR